MWTPKWEMEQYWDKVMASKEFTQKYKDEFLADVKRFGELLIDQGTVVDVGAGAFGGVFGFFNVGNRKIMVDPMATLFHMKYSKIPDDVELVDAYCSAIPLPDGVADTVFCIETLDHCNSIEDFNKSIEELKRIVKKNGHLFLMVPIRNKETPGHFITVDKVDGRAIIGKLSGFKIVHELLDFQELYIVAQKE